MDFIVDFNLIDHTALTAKNIKSYYFVGSNYAQD